MLQCTALHCTALQDLAAYLSQLTRQQELTVGEIARLEGGASARTGAETLPQLLELLAALKRVQPIAPVRSFPNRFLRLLSFMFVLIPAANSS